jgi:hypothetical protein
VERVEKPKYGVVDSSGKRKKVNSIAYVIEEDARTMWICLKLWQDDSKLLLL